MDECDIFIMINKLNIYFINQQELTSNYFTSYYYYLNENLAHG